MYRWSRPRNGYRSVVLADALSLDRLVHLDALDPGQAQHRRLPVCKALVARDRDEVALVDAVVKRRLDDDAEAHELVEDGVLGTVRDEPVEGDELHGSRWADGQQRFEGVRKGLCDETALVSPLARLAPVSPAARIEPAQVSRCA